MKNFIPSLVLILFLQIGYAQNPVSATKDSIPPVSSREEIEKETIFLTEQELIDAQDEHSNNITGILYAGKDVYWKTVAYDFSQAFFSPRGLGSAYQTVLINNIPMNKFYDKRPQWNNWGGLNDVFRNMRFNAFVSATPSHFGNLNGSVHFDTRASHYRPGTRISYAMSNRSYANRVMATYHSGMLKNNWAVSVSGSYRFAQSGFREGTPYKSYAFFTSIDKKLSDKHLVNFTGIFSQNERGRSSAMTEEVFDLKNNKYNPFWGFQSGNIRNARIRKVNQPVLQLNYFGKPGEDQNIEVHLSYQFGYLGNSRIDYGGTRLVSGPAGGQSLAGIGKNPDPSYYQYLPSYFLRDPDHPDYTGAYLAEKHFKMYGQINWSALYEANQNALGGNSVYALYEDRSDDNYLVFNTFYSKKWNQHFDLSTAFTYRRSHTANYALLTDLLGGTGFLDVDPYAENIDKAQNNLQNPNRLVGENEIYKYHYKITASAFNGYAQIQYHNRKNEFFIGADLTQTHYQREGLYENGGYPGSLSLGKSKALNFSTFRIKSGYRYKFTGRHIASADFAAGTEAPLYKNSFSNIRESNRIVKDLTPEKFYSAALSYYFRHPNIDLKISGYLNGFNDQTHIAFYFADGLTGLHKGENTAFIQEVLTGISKLNYGLESAVEIPFLYDFKFKSVISIGESFYRNNPHLYITSDAFEDELDYGKAALKNYFLSNGPQTALSAGIEYSSPDYWWVSLTGNYFDRIFVNIAPITRTANFYTDTDGLPFSDYNEEVARELLRQEQLQPYFLLNLAGGKSWKFNDKYIGFFISVNNLLNRVYRTGGYEQARNANYKTLLEDHNRIMPLFGNKYWFGYGTTFFASLSFSF